MRQQSAALPLAAAAVARTATSNRRLRVAGAVLIGAAAVSVVGDLGAVLALHAVRAMTPAVRLGLDKAMGVEGAVALFGTAMRLRAGENEQIAQERVADSGRGLSAG